MQDSRRLQAWHWPPRRCERCSTNSTARAVRFLKNSSRSRIQQKKRFQCQSDVRPTWNLSSTLPGQRSPM